MFVSVFITQSRFAGGSVSLFGSANCLLQVKFGKECADFWNHTLQCEEWAQCKLSVVAVIIVLITKLEICHALVRSASYQHADQTSDYVQQWMSKITLLHTRSCCAIAARLVIWKKNVVSTPNQQPLFLLLPPTSDQRRLGRRTCIFTRW